MAERRYLITGGTGYVGARLAGYLARNANVVVTQRTASEGRSAWLARSGVEALRFDSAKHSTLDIDGSFDAVINLAMPGAAEAARDPLQSRTHALTTAHACLKLLDQGRAGRVLHFSSFHVYGGPSRARYSEEDEVAPVHPYGQTHLACERLMLAHARTLVVRPSNIVAAPAHRDLGDQAKLMAVDLCRQAAAGAIHLNNDGLSYRDFLPFDDVAKAVGLLLHKDLVGERLFNLARGQAQRLDEVARLIQQSAEPAPTLSFGTGTDTFREPFIVSIDRLRSEGWQPGAALPDELHRLVAAFQ